jgi:hypothetical protein
MNSSQTYTSILMWIHKKRHLVYIVCEMKFMDKTYGLNLLIVQYLQIGLQL